MQLEDNIQYLPGETIQERVFNAYVRDLVNFVRSEFEKFHDPMVNELEIIGQLNLGDNFYITLDGADPEALWLFDECCDVYDMEFCPLIL